VENLKSEQELGCVVEVEGPEDIDLCDDSDASEVTEALEDLLRCVICLPFLVCLLVRNKSFGTGSKEFLPIRIMLASESSMLSSPNWSSMEIEYE